MTLTNWNEQQSEDYRKLLEDAMPGSTQRTPGIHQSYAGPPIRVDQLVRTCLACPAQWEGMTTDGRPLYIRYRSGHGEFRLGAVGGTIYDAVNAEALFSWEGEDWLDGYLEDDELLALCTSQHIELPPQPWA